MKLRNKQTGVIIEACSICENGQGKIVMRKKGENFEIYPYEYNSLAELNKEWEDAPEEPKEYWYVSCDGRALKATTDEDDYNEKHISGHKSIGNYFETKEEAEKAVERLRAWKRLKDKGFINEQVFSMNLNWCDPDDDDWKAFKLLFGGGE